MRDVAMWIVLVCLGAALLLATVFQAPGDCERQTAREEAQRRLQDLKR